MSARRQDPVERLLRGFDIDDAGCWVWRGAKVRRGYGVIQVAGKLRRAHRFAYESLVGPIPDGLVIDHLCRNTGCVNPEHLEPVTDRTNILRGEGPAAANAAKTHCVNGHAFDAENTRVVAGKRQCVTCLRASNAASERRRRIRLKTGRKVA